ncbi:phage tail protein [Pseudomonas sp. CF161]|uniref:phage tail protein n=1 Tax=Pseudomonas sp. CF161 TaxID=911241 RepID=UPI0003551AA0|nr:phage tail protein [Pseudomonas sp. CF161]EPL03876.1 putative prophage LambdaSo, minor tail protein M [Pseudomonas sp. CF161]
MATETFTWTPNGDPAATINFRTKSAKFGDGYEQKAADGINNRTQSWPLTFSGQKARIKEIMAFLDRQAGATPFYWTDPLGDQQLYRCAEYQPKAMGGDTYTLTATFEQAFHP